MRYSFAIYSSTFWFFLWENE